MVGIFDVCSIVLHKLEYLIAVCISHIFIDLHVMGFTLESHRYFQGCHNAEESSLNQMAKCKTLL